MTSEPESACASKKAAPKDPSKDRAQRLRPARPTQISLSCYVTAGSESPRISGSIIDHGQIFEFDQAKPLSMSVGKECASLLSMCIHVIAKNLHTYQVLIFLALLSSFLVEHFLLMYFWLVTKNDDPILLQSLDPLPADLQQQVLERRLFICEFGSVSRYFQNYAQPFLSFSSFTLQKERDSNRRRPSCPSLHNIRGDVLNQNARPPSMVACSRLREFAALTHCVCTAGGRRAAAPTRWTSSHSATVTR